jgi:hypothetical protein
MTFLLKWRHQDGSIVEFSDTGWRSDDCEKQQWLTHMNELCSSVPAVSPAIRIWLQHNCKLIEFSGPREMLNQTRIRHKQSSLDLPNPLTRSKDNGASPVPVSNRKSFFRRRTRRQTRLDPRSIDLACEAFFRSRGMTISECFNRWRKSNPPEEQDQ